MIHSKNTSGFTLIELSIVLVIIGLLAGGVLLGQDLIHAAQLRSLVSQKDKFLTAINTFKLKYNYLPGDMPPTEASQLGFFTFTGSLIYLWGGNNNGIINGSNPEYYYGFEGAAMWRHLAEAKLIEGNYGMDANKPINPNTNAIAGTPTGESIPYTLKLYMPLTTLGNGYWGAVGGDSMSFQFSGTPIIPANKNYFFIQTQGTVADPYPKPTLSAIDAYNIDSKIDDGLPNQGKVLMTTYDYLLGTYVWWSSITPTSGANVCTYGGSTYKDVTAQYNRNASTGGNNITCQPFFVW